MVVQRDAPYTLSNLSVWIIHTLNQKIELIIATSPVYTSWAWNYICKLNLNSVIETHTAPHIYSALVGGFFILRLRLWIWTIVVMLEKHIRKYHTHSPNRKGCVGPCLLYYTIVYYRTTLHLHHWWLVFLCVVSEDLPVINESRVLFWPQYHWVSKFFIYGRYKQLIISHTPTNNVYSNQWTVVVQQHFGAA